MCGYINRKGGPVWKSQNRALVGTSPSTGANRPPHPEHSYTVGVGYLHREAGFILSVVAWKCISTRAQHYGPQVTYVAGRR
jgi:hypothetical protein